MARWIEPGRCDLFRTHSACGNRCALAATAGLGLCAHHAPQRNRPYDGDGCRAHGRLGAGAATGAGFLFIPLPPGRISLADAEPLADPWLGLRADAFRLRMWWWSRQNPYTMSHMHPQSPTIASDLSAENASPEHDSS